jgi:hypothetical protein
LNIIDGILSRKVSGGLKPFKKPDTWANWIVPLFFGSKGRRFKSLRACSL